jgi:phosphosulfolactate synthase
MIQNRDNKKAFDFVDVITRDTKPRKSGITMLLDKGIGLNQACDLMQAADYIDLIKLGWATPCMLSEDILAKKIALYKENNIIVGNGGTLLEIVNQQKKTEEFFKYCLKIGIELIEVSNGVTNITPSKKAEIIRAAKRMGLNVVSEIGKKNPAEDMKLSLEKRLSEAKSDVMAGADYVIIEAREAGRGIGVYDDSGRLKEKMAEKLAEEIGLDNIMFEAPEKSQQANLILLFGSNVNLGNIRPEDIIPLETLRRGIRGDTFGKM